jgi:hypothetical protein
MAVVRPFRFTCRLLPPWDENRWGFTTTAGFKHWFEDVSGGQMPSTSCAAVREWVTSARPGDALLLDDDLELADEDRGEIEITCNW